MTEHDAYGLWMLVVLNSAIFIFFAFSFTKPRTRLDWRSLGAFSAFVVALFSEMYGFPLTIYLLSGWLQSLYPELDLFSHESGHLWHTLLGMEGDPHFDVLHLASNLMILGGFFMLASAWHVLHRAQQQHRLATTGLYARMRHPQYAAFMLVMFGFLLQWPTLLTLIMFPVLVVVYTRLAKREEAQVIQEFGDEYRRYRAKTPAFVPRLRNQGGVASGRG
ncbi:methyltransferase family protein [Marinobacterium rhizophilum]|uniref:methyltransferase family protein n=1 Tax=Marinobacterium rhizophilum TaxID=420402 RepID=UPI0003A32846|nr:isoprenylcysteine carboxylmethyltransferase family protein [Marinobacterium rhizophilum]